MNFEKSNRGAKTLYFLKRNFNWMPFYIFQIDNSLSDTEGLSGSIINQNKVEAKKRDTIIISHKDGQIQSQQGKQNLKKSISLEDEPE